MAKVPLKAPPAVMTWNWSLVAGVNAPNRLPLSVPPRVTLPLTLIQS